MLGDADPPPFPRRIASSKNWSRLWRRLAGTVVRIFWSHIEGPGRDEVGRCPGTQADGGAARHLHPAQHSGRARDRLCMLRPIGPVTGADPVAYRAIPMPAAPLSHVPTRHRRTARCEAQTAAPPPDQAGERARQLRSLKVQGEMGLGGRTLVLPCTGTRQAARAPPGRLLTHLAAPGR